VSIDHHLSELRKKEKGCLFMKHRMINIKK